jgi:multimeric flavodoxin WrbA
MAINILAISSSPRIGGNTETLLDEMIRGSQDAISKTNRDSDFQIEKIRLANCNLLPCTQCDICLKNGDCPQPDDILPIYPKLLAADWFILASPIYFMAHCAQAKLLIDRCQSFWARRYILKQSLMQPGQKFRRGIFISVAATHGSKVFSGVKVTMKWFLDAMEMEYWDNLLVEGCDEKGSVRQHPSAMQDAYKQGQTIINTE